VQLQRIASIIKESEADNLGIQLSDEINYFMNKSISRNYVQLEKAYTAFLVTIIIVTALYMSSNFF